MEWISATGRARTPAVGAMGVCMCMRIDERPLWIGRTKRGAGPTCGGQVVLPPSGQGRRWAAKGGVGAPRGRAGPCIGVHVGSQSGAQ